MKTVLSMIIGALLAHILLYAFMMANTKAVPDDDTAVKCVIMLDSIAVCWVTDHGEISRRKSQGRYQKVDEEDVSEVIWIHA
jgi:hypothetical protein